MEWTISKLRKLCEDNGVSPVIVDLKWEDSQLSPRRVMPLSDTNFEIRIKKGDHHYTVSSGETEGSIVLELSNHGWAIRAEPKENSLRGWKRALAELLNESGFRKIDEAGGLHKIEEMLSAKMLKKAKQLGKVSEKSKVQIWGYGTYEYACWPDGVQRAIKIETSEGESKVEVHLLNDDLDQKADEVISHFKAVEKQEVGKTTLAEYLKELDKPPEVEIVDYEYSPGDKRSYGSLSVSFNLPFGKVELKDLAVSSSGGIEGGFDEKILVNGSPVVDDHYPSIEVPHYYSGVKTCERWEERAEESLKEDLQEWVNGLFESVKED